MTKADLIIKAVKARAVNVPMPRSMTTASGSIPSVPLLLIDIDTDQGIAGRIDPMEIFHKDDHGLPGGFGVDQTLDQCK